MPVTTGQSERTAMWFQPVPKKTRCFSSTEVTREEPSENTTCSGP